MHISQITGTLRQPATLALIAACAILILVAWRQAAAFADLRSAAVDAPTPANPLGTTQAETRRPLIVGDPFRPPLQPGARETGPVVRRTALNVQLRGVFHLADAEERVALLQSGNETRRLRVGEALQASVEIVEIHPDHVIVSNHGHRETVMLDRVTSSRSAAHSPVRRYGQYARNTTNAYRGRSRVDED